MLYQKGTQRIEVIVRKEGGGVRGANTVDPDDPKTTNQPDKDNAESAFTKRFLRTNITHGFAVARQLVRYGISYYVGGIGMRSGDQSLQDQVERTMEIAQDVTGFASSVAMGATYGSAGGPLGAALGAIFGVASNAGALASKYGTRRREYNFEIFKENNAIEYSRARAGINWTTGRLR